MPSRFPFWIMITPNKIINLRCRVPSIRKVQAKMGNITRITSRFIKRSFLAMMLKNGCHKPKICSVWWSFLCFEWLNITDIFPSPVHIEQPHCIPMECGFSLLNHMLQYGGFLKLGYPQLSSIKIGFSIVNHQTIRFPP